MKKIAYLECPTGIAGDMCLGALVHVGVPLEYLQEQLAKLGISHEYHLRAEHIHHNGQLATKVHVDLLLDETLNHHHQPDRSFSLSRESDGSHGDPRSTHDHRSSHGHNHEQSPEDNHGHTYDREPNQEQTHNHHSPDHDDQPDRHRHLPEITQLITQAGLPPRARDWSLAVFQRLAEAEGAVHGVPPSQVHFHEVGATDAIVDIVGTCLGLDWLGLEELYCSALPTGGGTVWAAHGRLPVPVPAVLQLWQSRGCPIYSNGIDHELVTPTGAAIAVTLAKDFGDSPAMVLRAIGLGAGTQQLPIPNILRLWIGEKQESRSQPPPHAHSYPQPQKGLDISTPSNSLAAETVPQITLETIAVLETQIDDLSPQAISYACDRLLQVGALDVFTQGITMKKSRLGTLLTVMTPVAKILECEAVLFQETSTLGIRRSIQERSILQREIHSVTTEHGTVRVKVAWQLGEKITNIQPEYEDCAAIARATNLPLREIHAATLQSWRQGGGDRTSL